MNSVRVVLLRFGLKRLGCLGENDLALFPRRFLGFRKQAQQTQHLREGSCGSIRKRRAYSADARSNITPHKSATYNSALRSLKAASKRSRVSPLSFAPSDETFSAKYRAGR